MTFHAVIYSIGWSLHGSALMVVFFLLAGYSLAIAYGDGERPAPFSIKRFYRNRFARIAPVYYAAMLLALPVAFYGRSWVPPDAIGWVFLSNLFAVQMWPGQAPLSFAGPAWTISTLAFFYLAFPWLLRWHQRQSDRALARWLVALFVVQALVCFGISFAIGPFDPSWSFWASHAWPLSRLPVFDMALVAGLLVLRQGRADRDTAVRVMGVATGDGHKWAGRIDWRAGLFVGLLVLLSVVSIVGVDLWGSWWVQGVFPYLLLQVIVGLSLTAPGSLSVTQRVLTWPPLLAAGRIALALYLVHEVVIYYVAWIARPERPFGFAAMPVWGIAVMVPVSVVLAILLERYVERPARRFLRGETAR